MNAQRLAMTHVRNLEQVVATAPWLTMLVTSRIALDITGEQRLHVPPLPVPASTGADPLDRFEGDMIAKSWIEYADTPVKRVDPNVAPEPCPPCREPEAPDSLGPGRIRR